MALKSPDVFNSKSELEKYTRNIVNGIGVCSSLKNYKPHEYNFFRILFQRHPEKEKKQTDTIMDIITNNHPKGGIVFSILRADATKDTISWKACVIMRSDTINKKRIQAFRVAVDPQIQKCRSNKSNRCSECKSSSDLEVDHTVKSFAQLMRDFIVIHPNYPKEFAKNSMQQHCFKDEDILYQKTWEVYHLSNACLQILCHTCHQKKTYMQNVSK